MEGTLADRRYTVDRAQLIRRLRAVLPASALLAEEEEMRPYDCDGLTAFRQLPLLVALPENEAQALAIPQRGESLPESTRAGKEINYRDRHDRPFEKSRFGGSSLSLLVAQRDGASPWGKGASLLGAEGASVALAVTQGRFVLTPRDGLAAPSCARPQHD